MSKVSRHNNAYSDNLAALIPSFLCMTVYMYATTIIIISAGLINLVTSVAVI